MRKLFIPIVVVAAAMFAWAPIGIARVEYESTMLLVQKIFYFHFATWMAVTASVTVCGIASAIYLFRGTAAADHYAVASAELTTIFCLFGMFSGSLWGRKAWGVWWQWDARLTMAFLLELVFFGYLLVRKYGGPGAEKLAAAMGIFGAATAPFIYKSVDWWRTIHPQTTVMKTLGDKFPAAWNLVWLCSVAFLLLFVVTLAARVRLEQLRAQLDRAYLAAEE
jgi:heme exporter protein C